MNIFDNEKDNAKNDPINDIIDMDKLLDIDINEIVSNPPERKKEHKLPNFSTEELMKLAVDSLDKLSKL